MIKIWDSPGKCISLQKRKLIVASLFGQFLGIQSPDRACDHDIVSGNLKEVYPQPQLTNHGGIFIVIRKVTMNLCKHMHLYLQKKSISMDIQILVRFTKTQ